MFLVRLRAVAIALCLIGSIVQGAQRSPVNRSWPPGVQQVSDQSPPLPPEAALETFHMPPGYRLELVASEPLVQEPVAIDWDISGRLWAVEMPGFMADIAGSNEHQPIGRVVVLQDTDRDGRMDTRTVFADGLVLARSIKVLDGGVLVGEPPNAWLMRDTDGDLRMDSKVQVSNQYGRFDVDPQNNANGFYWAMDNRIYTAGQSDIQFRPASGGFEVEKTLRRGEWGVTQDDAGRIYRNTNESALHVDLVPTYYYARHPDLLRTRGSYDRLADSNPDLNVVWPVRPNPGTNRAYQAGIDRADGTLAKFTSVCAPLVYRGDRLPAELRGNVFVAEPAANLVSRIVLEEDGTGLHARKAYERGEFLASTDERFRPVYLSDAPDGTLYIVDLYRGIIEHRISITTYLRDHIMKRKLDTATGYGRIYRVVHETTERNLSSIRTDAPSAELVKMLEDPNGWRRDAAQRRIVERADKSVAPALVALARDAGDWRVRLHALWTLDGLDAIEPELVARALEDRSPHVRRSAVRVAERWIGQPGHSLSARVLARLDDEDLSVRQQLGASLGALPPGQRETAVASLLDRYATDPVTLDAALSSVRGGEAAVLEALMRPDAQITTSREAAMTMLAATIVRGAGDAGVQAVFTRIADEGRPAWQRSALLRGAEVALMGAPMPGAPARRAEAASAAPLPCPTCPGGRAGPGGAYAFPRPENWASIVGGGRSDQKLRLAREPRALTTMSSGDELGKRATALMERVTWPGKPGEAAPVAPLTAAEQARFDLGRDIYGNVCQSCHQPDGRGQEKLVPPLRGSALALAPAEIPVRILLHGKEGTIGLMPPIGSTFTDEQVASVLTYVRREWGHAATPVDAAVVKDVRARTADRARPWTDAELKALAEQVR